MFRVHESEIVQPIDYTYTHVALPSIKLIHPLITFDVFFKIENVTVPSLPNISRKHKYEANIM